MSNRPKLTRRQALMAGAAATAGATMAFAGVEAAAKPETNRAAKRVLRLAHLTDVHVQPEKGGGDGFAACLRHVQSQTDKPALILFGGDNVMNVDGDGRDRAGVQLKLWRDVLQAECELPYRTVIGNHDILAMDPVDGKKWARDAYGLAANYYFFDEAGWRFVVLDSTEPGDGGGYKGRLDDEQFEWLTQTVEETPKDTPVCVVSHIAICTVTPYFDGENEKTGDWVIPGSWMHIDAKRMKDLFYKHSNVKLCLSGHAHLTDEIEYLGVKYACDGAVSGAWWNGAYHELEPGYALIDLYEDGSSAIEYVTYGWKAREA
jgi:3',5'-cyclic AMP phosphodiesterase CpdA